jgi:hypothetical protein
MIILSLSFKRSRDAERALNRKIFMFQRMLIALSFLMAFGPSPVFAQEPNGSAKRDRQLFNYRKLHARK